MKRFLSPAGFTLIELLVVLGIFAVFTGMGILNLNRSQGAPAISRATKEVVNIIRRAQNFSLAAEPSASGRVACGFGVHFDEVVFDDATLVLFQEDPDPALGSCESIYATADPQFDRQYDPLEEFGPPLRLTDNGAVKIAAFPSDIFFEAPDGIMWINNQRNPRDRVDIDLCLRSDCTGTKATVRVTLGGAVEIVR